MKIESTNGNEIILKFNKDNATFKQTLNKYSTKIYFDFTEDFVLNMDFFIILI